MTPQNLSPNLAADRPAVWGHDIAGIANEKQVARVGHRDQVRMHARIGTSDEQGDRLLLFAGEVLEQFAILRIFVAAKPLDAGEDLVHGCSSLLVGCW
jgi:hypothetical protein